MCCPAQHYNHIVYIERGAVKLYYCNLVIQSYWGENKSDPKWSVGTGVIASCERRLLAVSLLLMNNE